jgi:DNA-binding IclR family transcriptional regulator
VPSHLFALCLVHDQGEGADGCRPHLRELVPCHCTAAGKALLAWRDEWRDAVLDQTLTSFTERTSVGPESLRRELARTVARGYSVEDREYQPDTRGLAAPVFSSAGEAVAALAVVAPVERLQADRYGEVGAAVMSAAAALSAELGYAPALAA